MEEPKRNSIALRCCGFCCKLGMFETARAAADFAKDDAGRTSGAIGVSGARTFSY